MDPDGAPQRLLARLDRVNPYWGAQLVVLAAIALDVSLPNRLTIGPAWVLPSVEGLLLLGLIVTAPHPYIRGSPRRRQAAIAMIALVSAVNAVSVVLLVHYLLRGASHVTGHRLIVAGSVLWVTNVLLFGLWYWELDRGGPIRRRERVPGPPDMLFPQMTVPELFSTDWQPNLVDYMYVSFTNATAFSPTDTMPLTAGVKILMTIQSLVSLVTVGLVVARAVNILA
jgi:uncharacterized membrane protein